MKDETNKVLEVFNEYGEAFELLKPKALLAFYHYPSMLISQDKSVVIKNGLEAWLVFAKLIADLKRQNFDRSVIHKEKTKVKFLSENLATITGTATRYKKDDTELESFDFTYTMRKVSDDWKIIVGIIHDLGSNS